MFDDLNRGRIERLADVIEVSETFDQSQWLHEEDDFCGTPACIAGHARAICVGPEGSVEFDWQNETGEWVGIADWAQEWLGLSDRQAKVLFSSEPHSDWPEPWQGQWIDSILGAVDDPGDEAMVEYAISEVVSGDSPSLEGWVDRRRIAVDFLRHIAKNGWPSS